MCLDKQDLWHLPTWSCITAAERQQSSSAFRPPLTIIVHDVRSQDFGPTIRTFTRLSTFKAHSSEARRSSYRVLHHGYIRKQKRILSSTEQPLTTRAVYNKTLRHAEPPPTSDHLRPVRPRPQQTTSALRSSTIAIHQELSPNASTAAIAFSQCRQPSSTAFASPANSTSLLPAQAFYQHYATGQAELSEYKCCEKGMLNSPELFRNVLTFSSYDELTHSISEPATYNVSLLPRCIRWVNSKGYKDQP
jgi:hypothetical protein